MSVMIVVMRFHRQDLIVRVDAAIAARRQAVQESNAREAEQYAERLANYVESTRDAWRQLADTIRQRLRAGKPMLGGDIPRELRGGWNHGVWTGQAPTLRAADTAALEQLRVLLEASVDDEVSMATLERMGFRTAQLFTR